MYKNGERDGERKEERRIRKKKCVSAEHGERGERKGDRKQRKGVGRNM